MSGTSKIESCASSMTGFGQAVSDMGGLNLRVECKSVNNRFLDVVLRLPKVYQASEAELRNLVSQHCQRGRVELLVTRVSSNEGTATPEFRRAVFEQSISSVESALGVVEFTHEIRTALIRELLSRREVLDFVEPTLNADAEKELLMSTARKALQELAQQRRVEGENLQRDILARFEALSGMRQLVATATNDLSQQLRHKLQERVTKFAPDVQLDPQRLAAEVVMMVDKSDVTEELVRLESHLSQAVKTAREPGSGRKMEFWVQECGREFNTIGSKAQNAAVQTVVVGAKVELEKIREQIQNLE